MIPSASAAPCPRGRLGPAVLVVTIGGCMIPGRSFDGSLPPLDQRQRQLSRRLEQHVTRLASQIGERHVWRHPALDRAADYIEGSLRSARYATVYVQRYEASLGAVGGSRTVKNLEVQLLGSRWPEEIVIVGAHYDTVRGTPGANDNGTGVAALLELARRFGPRPGCAVRPARTLRFVAFVNEEPPFFQGEQMGSLVYARRCQRRGERVVAMLSLETIGCYSDARGSQRYPFPFSLLYPDTGNFIGFIGNLRSAGLVRRAVASFRRHARFPSEAAAVPGFITGIGWSDHWSFWQAGYPALMVTDTAPFRYAHYHRPTDTVDRIDFDRTARVVDGLAQVIADLAAGPSAARHLERTQRTPM